MSLYRIILLSLHSEIEPKTQTCVERCKAVKNLIQGTNIVIKI